MLYDHLELGNYIIRHPLLYKRGGRYTIVPVYKLPLAFIVCIIQLSARWFPGLPSNDGVTTGPFADGK